MITIVRNNLATGRIAVMSRLVWRQVNSATITRSGQAYVPLRSAHSRWGSALPWFL